MPSRSAVGRWPLVGRDDVLGDARAALAEDHLVLTVAGDRGTGRSRIASELAHVGELSGRRTLVLRPSGVEVDVPFAALSGVLPDRAPSRDQMSSEGADGFAELLRHWQDVLQVAARTQPLLIVVDDAHLLDPMTATVIHQLAFTRMASVIVTVARGMSTLEPIIALWKEGLGPRVELRPLNDEQILGILRTELGGDLDTVTARELIATAAGNLVYLRELVVESLRSHNLRYEGGLWRIADELTLPSSLEELVSVQLTKLSPAERELLEVLACVGPLAPEVLAAVSDLAAAETLDRDRLITASDAGRDVELSVSHPVHRLALRKSVSPLRVRSLSATALRTLRALRGTDDSTTVQAARLALQAGALPEDSAQLWHALDVTIRAGDSPLAAELGLSMAERGTVGEILHAAIALRRLGYGPAARQCLDLAETHAGQAAIRSRICLERAIDVIDEGGRLEDAAQLVRTAGRIVDESPTDSGDAGAAHLVAVARADIVLLRDGPATALPLARAAAAECVADESHLSCRGLGVLAATLTRLGATAEAERLSRVAGTSSPVAFADLWSPPAVRLDALIGAGRFAEADAEQRRQEAVLTRRTDRVRLAHLVLHSAGSVVDRGHCRETLVSAGAAVLTFRDDGLLRLAAAALALQVQAAALVGDLERVETAWRELAELEVEPTRPMAADRALAAGWRDCARGELQRARRMFEQGADEAERAGDLLGAVSLLHSLARCGWAAAAAPAVEELGVLVDGPLPALRRQHVRAMAEQDAAELSSVSEAFAELDAPLLAAEAMAGAAVASSAAGQSQPAAQARQRARQMLAGYDHWRTPALLLIPSIAQLTPAELEAARLAARGASNRDIAERLVIAVRTVENRLQLAYRKLGITSRSELGAALEAAGH